MLCPPRQAAGQQFGRVLSMHIPMLCSTIESRSAGENVSKCYNNYLLSEEGNNAVAGVAREGPTGRIGKAPQEACACRSSTTEPV